MEIFVARTCHLQLLLTILKLLGGVFETVGWLLTMADLVDGLDDETALAVDELARNLEVVEERIEGRLLTKVEDGGNFVLVNEALLVEVIRTLDALEELFTVEVVCTDVEILEVLVEVLIEVVSVKLDKLLIKLVLDRIELRLEVGCG